MTQDSLSQVVSRLVEPVLRDEGLELFDIEYKNEGKRWFLRIFIDKPSGVTLDDCQNASHLLEGLIEVENLIEREFVLEVSSPGLDRPLKKERDFLRNLNRRIRLTTFSPIHNQKNFSGVVKDFKDGFLCLETKKELVKIPLESIAKARLEIDFS
tara:strand:- start:443 stop:907 length:465 start_codon:yes stop_codon:yes gene_type:complete